MNSDKLSGQVIAGRFTIVRLLGEGGFGSVYLATQLGLDRQVAIKLMHQYIVSPETLRRFEREARILAGIQHKNIVTCHAAGLLLEKIPFMVLELIEGPTLRDLLQCKTRLDWREAFKIGVELCDALSVIHEAGVIHRDLKPDNLIITNDRTTKVIDFGLVHSEEQRLTKTGCIVGTLAYMSPEHATGNQATALSDIYSMGCILYEAISGKPPFLISQDNPELSAFQIRPALLSSTIPDVPAAVDFVLSRAIALSPETRYQTAADVRKELIAVLEGATPEGMPLSINYGTHPKSERKHPLLLTVIASMAIAISVIAYAGSMQRTSTTEPKDSTQTFNPELAKKAVPQISEMRAKGLVKESIVLAERLRNTGAVKHMTPSTKANYYINIASSYGELKDYAQGAKVAREGLSAVPIEQSEQGSLLDVYIRCCLHLPKIPDDTLPFVRAHIAEMEKHNQVIRSNDEPYVGLAALNLASGNEEGTIKALSGAFTYPRVTKFPAQSTYILSSTKVDNPAQYLGLQLNRLAVYCSLNTSDLCIKAVELAEKNSAFNEFRTEDKLELFQDAALNACSRKEFDLVSSYMAKSDKLLGSSHPSQYDVLSVCEYPDLKASLDLKNFGSEQAVAAEKQLLAQSETPAWKRVLVYETIAELYNRRGLRDEAYKTLAAAAKEFPDNIAVLVKWSATCRKMDRISEYKALAARAKKIDKKKAEWLIFLTLGDQT